jgi:hypothetical protein
MPRDGAIIFSDLIGKLDLLRAACDKCGRDGCYGLSHFLNSMILGSTRWKGGLAIKGRAF